MIKYLLKLHCEKKKQGTIPAPTKNVNMYFVVFFYCDKAQETIWNPTSTTNVRMYFVVFLLLWKRLMVPSGTLTPPKRHIVPSEKLSIYLT